MKIDTVVKVGGSLYDLPNLGSRLGEWLAGLKASNLVLVPGGGPTADLVRAWDRQHKLGEETSHWLALRALTCNAHLLAALLPGSRVTRSLDDAGAISILDMHGWAKSVDHLSDRFPHTWDVTSDSLAVQVAMFGEARRLFLLKSVPLPDGMNWHEAARKGIVDPFFSRAVRMASGSLTIRIVSFR
jgi:5-(aminomethyl)-3-furanmethanol phosphate kinase